MDFAKFKESLQTESPPSGLSELAKALWYDGNGDWETAHNISQDIDSADGNWVHAYLHRKEGDQWNAGYWYRQAGRPMPAYDLRKEWEELVRYFLNE